ncbi:hypothetical protein [Streptomyces sp. KS_5]|uniref:hypothetical protein n=1 Tax=Streptomyces sp. KS_5 TaxID=1881018 RepID=UPI000897C838|nr:hypothetical protein [Streptomyces sp. KS_5]SEE35328.1 hypothetical protein SAMN05428938_7966 [Streptomyces sp. KS_5]
MNDANRWLVEVRFTCEEGRFVRLFYMVDNFPDCAQVSSAAHARADAECERRGKRGAATFSRQVQVQAVFNDPLRGVGLSAPLALTV